MRRMVHRLQRALNQLAIHPLLTFRGCSRTTALAIAFGAVVGAATQAQEQAGGVENLGAAPASQLVAGLGFNVNPLNDWEFKAAAAAGATSVRFQCGWENIETQTPAPANTNRASRFVLTNACAQGIASAARYALKPTVLAAYGPPYHELGQFTVPNGATAGSRTLNIQLTSVPAGVSTANIKPFFATILAQDRSYLTRLHGYAGGLVVGVSTTDSTHASLSLASALLADVPASTSMRYSMNEYLYAPPASFSPTDSSNLAFAAYAKFLASSIGAAGILGEVEIWNEPPWQDDPWDQRYRYYDDMTGAMPGPDQARLANYGFAAILQTDQYAIRGVNYVWGGTHKTGATSVFDYMRAATGVEARQPAIVLTTEAWHPYGNTPEDGLWSQPCMKAAVIADSINPYPGFFQCNLFGLAGGNSSLGEWYNLRQKLHNPTYGIKREITETGIPALFADNAHRVRYLLRQFLGYQAAGVTPIQFYRLYDTSDYNFSFVTSDGGHTPLPQLLALTSLVRAAQDLSAQTPNSQWTSPSVGVYNGRLPLTTVTIVGRRAESTTNSLLFTLWQRSQGSVWATTSSPAPERVQLGLPSELFVSRVVNLTTQQAIQYDVTGRDLTFHVSDDPIGVYLDPMTISAPPAPPTGLRRRD